MSMETYRLVVEETAEREGLSVDVYDEDDAIVETTRVPYADYDLRADGEGDGDRSWSQAVNVDALSLTLEVRHDGEAFDVTLFADGEAAARERVAHDDLGVVAAG